MRTGSVNDYSAVFKDASRLETGDTVRVAGIRVGTVQEVSLEADRDVLVKFDAGKDIVLTDGTKAQIKYLNLVGDRYLELVDAPGSTKILPAGAQIPIDRTAPALDLDLLLGGLKPVIQGLNPQDVNALSAIAAADTAGPGRHHRIAVLQDVVVLECAGGQQPGDRATHRRPQDDVEDALRGRRPVRPRRSTSSNELVRGLSEDRDPIGEAITALDNGTASLSDLLGRARPPLDGTVDQVKRLAEYLDADKDRFDATIQQLPEDLPQAGAGGLLRRVLPLLHLRNRFPCQRSRGSHRSVPLDQARDGEVPGRMNKYRGSSLIRAGFIGVVLIILVIAIGLQPERLVSWATALRYQALFTEGGGLTVGNDVTVSGIKVGSVSSVGLENGDALVGFTINGKYALGSDTTAHIRTGTLLGERVLALESEGSGTLSPEPGHPDVADVVSVFVDRGGQ